MAAQCRLYDLGRLPGEGSEEYLIPPSVFASSEDVDRFRDVARRLD